MHVALFLIATPKPSSATRTGVRYVDRTYTSSEKKEFHCGGGRGGTLPHHYHRKSLSNRGPKWSKMINNNNQHERTRETKGTRNAWLSHFEASLTAAGDAILCFQIFCHVIEGSLKDVSRTKVTVTPRGVSGPGENFFLAPENRAEGSRMVTKAVKR